MENVIDLLRLIEQNKENQEDLLSDIKRYIAEDWNWIQAQEDGHGYELQAS